MDQTCLSYESGANLFSGSGDISNTNKNNHRLTAPKTEPSTVHSMQ